MPVGGSSHIRRGRVILSSWIRLARPQQWVKNLIVLAGVIFSGHLLDQAFALRAVGGFLVFCIASSAIYVINDVADAQKDRQHPEKKYRPVAAGEISGSAALLLAAFMTAAALAGAWALGLSFLGVVTAFLILNVLYSVIFKTVVILDVLMIAMSFILRAIGGVAVLWTLDRSVEISPWLLVCTFFLALFLGFGKRRNELSVLPDAKQHRASLQEYSLQFLDQLINIVTAGAVISYATYTLTPGTVAKFGTNNLVYTLPFVVYGVFRYLHLIRHHNLGGNPTKLLFADKILLITVLLWTSAVIVVIYAGSR